MPRQGHLSLALATPAARLALGSFALAAAQLVAPVGASDRCLREPRVCDEGAATPLTVDEIEELEALEVESMQVQLLQRAPARAAKALTRPSAVFDADAEELVLSEDLGVGLLSEASVESVAIGLAGSMNPHESSARGSTSPVTIDEVEETEALEVESIRVQMLQQKLLRPTRSAVVAADEEELVVPELGVGLLAGSLVGSAPASAELAADGPVATEDATEQAAVDAVEAEAVLATSLLQTSMETTGADTDGARGGSAERAAELPPASPAAKSPGADGPAPGPEEDLARRELAALEAFRSPAVVAVSEALRMALEDSSPAAVLTGEEDLARNEFAASEDDRSSAAPALISEAMHVELDEESFAASLPKEANGVVAGPRRNFMHRAFALAGWELVEFKLHHAVIFVVIAALLACASFYSAIFLHAVFVTRCLVSSPAWRKQYLQDTKRFRQESCLPPPKTDERLVTEAMNTYPSSNVHWRVPAASAGFDCAMVKPTSSGEPLRLEGTIEGPLHADPLLSPLTQRPCVMYAAGVWQETGEPLASSAASVGFTVSLLGAPQTRVQVQGGDAILFDAHAGKGGGAYTEALQPGDAPEHCREFLRTAASASPGPGATPSGRSVAVSDAPLVFQERAMLIGSTVTLIGELHRGATGVLSLRPWQRDSGTGFDWTPEAVKEPEACVAWEPWKSSQMEGQAVLGGLMNVLVSDDPELLS